MARNKEALVLVLDVGPTMHQILPEIEKICSLLIQKKLIFSKSDEVGVVLFGTEGNSEDQRIMFNLIKSPATVEDRCYELAIRANHPRAEETKNDLTVEVGGYDHVMVLQPTKVVDGELVEAVQQLPRGTVAGDFLDAIVVGMDMMIKKFGPTNKGKKRLCLITNGISPLKDPYEGTKEDQVSTIASQMAAHGMKMECVIVRMKQTLDTVKSIAEENDILFSIFSKASSTKALYVENPTKLLGAIQTRKISPVTIFRGDFELSSQMKIKVWVYKKTSQEKFPTLKKYSDKAPPTDKFATHEIKVDYEYKRADDSSKVVPPEQRIKGFRYGPQVVPISPAEWEAVKFKPEKGVKLLGFTNASNIMRHYYMKDVNLFIAEPGSTRATISISALARAMKEMNKVAIVRCVWRQGQGNVVVGVLTPNISDDDKIADSFYFNVLPFAEDVREFQFPSFGNLPSSLQPTQQQQEAADKFVEMLDLAPTNGEEALEPDFTPNPSLERFYRYLELKSKDPEAAVPPLDATLRKITEPDPELLSQNKFVVDDFCRYFEIKENPKLKKSTKRLLRDKPSGSNEEIEDLGKGNDAQPMDSIEYTSKVKVEKIGDKRPVEDFEALMSRRDGTEWVSKSIQMMKNKISNLVEQSRAVDAYEKALECLMALRKGCILEQEPKQFNDFLQHLYRNCVDKNLKIFCNYLANHNITLISKTEAIDSEFNDEEAKTFMVKAEPVSES